MAAPQHDGENEQHTLDLVNRARDRDPAAWDEIFLRHRAVLRAMVSGSLPNELRSGLETEDLLQSAFLSAWRSLDGFEYRGRGSLRKWLGTILVHKLRDKVRNSRSALRDVHVETLSTDADLVQDTAAIDPAAILERADREAAALAAIDALPPQLQEIVCLHRIDGLSYSAIAARLGLAEETVRAREHRAVDRIARLL